MTQDEIIEMAIQGHASTRDAIRWAMNQEREACAMLCLWHNNAFSQKPTLFHMAQLIRERGQA